MAEERLQKILARAGIASRRKAEELITSGRVRVEGRIVTELGTKADTRAKIEVDGRRIEREQLCYGVFHKPRQMVTTLSDPEGRPTAQDVLRQVGVRVVPVGRLDFNTSGALLFTNDGDFAQGLSHAKSNVPKVYVATVQGVPDERKLARWGESIEVEGKRTRPAQVRILRREEGKSWLEVTIHEGKNRQVRRLAEHADTPVVRLSRLSHAGITTEGLRPGEWRLLSVDELKELKKTYGVPEKIRGVMENPPARPARPLGPIVARRARKPITAPERPRREEGRSSARSSPSTPSVVSSTENFRRAPAGAKSPRAEDRARRQPPTNPDERFSTQTSPQQRRRTSAANERRAEARSTALSANHERGARVGSSTARPITRSRRESASVPRPKKRS